MGDPVVELPATEQRRLLAAREISAGELLDAHLERIAAVNPAVNAVIALDPDVEYPTEVGGRRFRSYIDWMAVCYRVTVMGCPALSLPAGFDTAGLPVGIQLVGAPGRDMLLAPRRPWSRHRDTGCAGRRW